MGASSGGMTGYASPGNGAGHEIMVMAACTSTSSGTPHVSVRKLRSVNPMVSSTSVVASPAYR